MKQTLSESVFTKIYGYVLSVGGALGLIAMTWQSSERIHMLKNPGVALQCNLNPVVDCGSVLGNRLAALFGFPNAFLGMIFFAILATSGLVLLSGGTFKHWYRHVVLAVTLFLAGFSVWFFGVSLYSIGKICIFCAVGWIVSVPIVWYGIRHYLQTAGPKLGAHGKRLLQWLTAHHIDVVVLTYALMLILFLTRFREYYFG